MIKGDIQCFRINLTKLQARLSPKMFRFRNTFSTSNHFRISLAPRFTGCKKKSTGQLDLSGETRSGCIELKDDSFRTCANGPSARHFLSCGQCNILGSYGSRET